MGQVDADVFRTFFNSALDLLCIATSAGRFKHLNPQWSRELGYDLDELSQMSLMELLHPDDQARSAEVLEQLQRENQETVSFQNRCRTKSGRYVWLLWSAARRGDALHAVARNITDLKTKEEFLRNIEKAANIGGWTYNVRTGELDWTDTTFHIHEIPPGKPPDVDRAIECMDPEGQSVSRSSLQRLVEHHEPYCIELPFTTMKGRRIWIRSTAHPYIYEDGEVVVMAGTIQDVSDFKAVEFKLEEQKLRLQRIIANSPGMVYQFRRTRAGQDTFPFVSAHAIDIYGVEPERFQREPQLFFSMVVREDQGTLRAALQKSAEQLSLCSWEGRIATADRREKWVKLRGSPRTDGDATVWDGIVVDITSDKQQEIELRNKMALVETRARLATIGEMAAGVGHEINNPLAIANGNVDRLASRLSELGIADPIVAECLERYQLASERIANVVGGLRAFVVGDRERGEAVDMRTLLEESLSLVGEMYRREGIDVRLELPAQPVHVEGKKGRLQQILMNFLSNSRDALQGAENATITVSVAVEGPSVRLCVRDNGPGIAPDDQARIFDAFFTTKPHQQGTGLGLNLVKNIVKEHGGTIALDSQPGEGTAFTVCLPASRAVVAPSGSGAKKTLAVGSGAALGAEPRKLRVLVVDDERFVRDLLRHILARLAYEPDLAATAQEALSKVETGRYDFVITDMKMPGMDGFDLARRLRERGRLERTPLIGITGGVNVPLGDGEGAQLFDGYLYKPFTKEELADLLAQLTRPPA